MDNYYGTYTIAKPTSNEQTAKLIGADNIVGDIYKVSTAISDGEYQAFATNRFGETPVKFNEEISRDIALNEAKGFISYAILVAVGFNTAEIESKYWGEFIVISFPDNEKNIFTKYVENISNTVKNNRLPEVDLNSKEFKQLNREKGDYISTRIHKKRDKEKGIVIIKSKVKLSEKLIELGRQKKVGCYIIGWLFLLIIITFLIFIVKSVFL